MFVAALLFVLDQKLASKTLDTSDGRTFSESSALHLEPEKMSVEENEGFSSRLMKLSAITLGEFPYFCPLCT